MNNLAAPKGIVASSGYFPRGRILHEVINQAMGWSRGRAKAGNGSRRFGNWDEDALTMAVEAARSLTTINGSQPGRLTFASTSAPFSDRSNVGLIREALCLSANTALQEVSGSKRAASSSLLEHFQSGSGEGQTGLLCASDCVETRAGGEAEPVTGHGAAALALGSDDVIASFLGGSTLHHDLVDSYRLSSERFDYRLEARWSRDAGIRKQVSKQIGDLLDTLPLTTADIDYFLFPAAAPVSAAIARDAHLTHSQRLDAMVNENGLCGCAQPLLMLNEALSQATPGQNILLAGVGQGFDLMLFRVEQAIEMNRPRSAIADTFEETNYARFIGVRRVLDIDGGIRSERDNRSSQSAAFRQHEAINGFVGGRCNACGKLQFPSTESCVHCHNRGEQQPESLASMKGEVNSFTEDWLAWSPRPPLIFGNVHFPGNANVMLEFADFEEGELEAGMTVRMAFRIKDFDDRRGFRRYFWKPAPMVSDHG